MFQYNVHQLVKHVTDRFEFRGVDYEVRKNVVAADSTMSGAFLTPEHTDFDFSSDVSLLPVLTCLDREGGIQNVTQQKGAVDDPNESLCESRPEMNSTELEKSPMEMSTRYGGNRGFKGMTLFFHF